MMNMVKDKNSEFLLTANREDVQIRNIEKELRDFNSDQFIQQIRDLQVREKEENKMRYEHLKKSIVKKGYTIYDDEFLPEYIHDYCYGSNTGSVLTLEKDGLIIELWANGEQKYYVFDENKFSNFLYNEAVPKGRLTKESADKLRKAVYYCLKLTIDGILKEHDYRTPIEALLNEDLISLTKEEKEFLMLYEYDFEELYANEDMLPDRLPISWYAGYYFCEDNNWIEIFFYAKKDGGEISLNTGDVYGGNNFLEALEDIDDLYQMGLEYLEEME